MRVCFNMGIYFASAAAFVMQKGFFSSS